jgi:hypothetical protein
MGQQQLLILVIVFMIGTVALIGATEYLDSVDQQNERDEIVTQIHNLIADAIKYKISPGSLGGGGGSWENFQPQRNKSETDRFSITASGYPNYIVFLGTSKLVVGFNGENFVQVLVSYYPQTQKIIVETQN